MLSGLVNRCERPFSRMTLDEAHTELGWPVPEQIRQPTGAGPRVLTEMAAARLGRNLSMASPAGVNGKVNTGMLFADSTGDRTEPPVAVVCEFRTHVSEAMIVEAHRLAWNFAHAPLLITLEPTRVMAWSCCVPPSSGNGLSPTEKLRDKFVGCYASDPTDSLVRELQGSSAENAALNSLHWINLLAGHHFEVRPERFKPEGRLDAVLLANLLSVRNQLRDDMALPEDACHDLLARLIFIQFLFQRKDSSGRPALHADKLAQLANEGVLENVHATLESLLNDYEDAYRLFGWLNERFNGDLFPGKGDTAAAREREWETEKAAVRPEHLRELASFIAGTTDLPSKQRFLWQHYSFDAIPLELISSIYEIFVGPPEKDKAYYTKGHLVDFMLDAVLPWEGKCAPLRILDPSCGSGIFLVKCFQRLVHRWKVENGNDPKPSDLRTILETQIFGVDINPHAVRVAAFSLYLAMCDALDPRHYWNFKRIFPQLRDHNLIAADFFTEDRAPFRTRIDAATFDLVIGNAPWGKGSAGDRRSSARQWAQEHRWQAPGQDHGPVFLAKGALLAKEQGTVSMLQPGGLLLNGSAPMTEFRRKLFSAYEFEEIINLSAVRRELFSAAIGPACIVTFRPKPALPTSEFAYVTPKPIGTPEDRLRTVIAPHDVHFVQHGEAQRDPLVWTALMWGGRRDLELVRRLSKRRSLNDLRKAGLVATREGVIRGKTKQKRQSQIIGRKFLAETNFPDGAFLHLRADALETNEDPMVHERDSTDFTAFDSPQLIFKQSWRARANRFQAVLVEPDHLGRGALCSDSYVSVRSLDIKTDPRFGLWLLLNSRFTLYWFALTAGQFAGFIPKATEKELRQMPLVECEYATLTAVSAKGYEAIDQETETILGLSEAERLLIEDLHEITFPDAQRMAGDPPGHHPVSGDELVNYCRVFCKALSATFGQDKQVCATIFEADVPETLPVQLVAIHLGWNNHSLVQSQRIGSPELISLLQNCHRSLMQVSGQGMCYQRVVETFQSVATEEGSIPTLYLIRPRQRRYWTRSLALREADRLASAIVQLGQPFPQAKAEESLPGAPSKK